MFNVLLAFAGSARLINVYQEFPGGIFGTCSASDSYGILEFYMKQFEEALSRPSTLFELRSVSSHVWVSGF